MCLAIPGQIQEVELDDDVRMGLVRFGGAIKRICLEHVPEAGPGDHVLVHVGFAIARVDAEQAERTLALLAELRALQELEAVDALP